MAGSVDTRTIIVQNRAKIVLDLTQNLAGSIIDTIIGSLENGLSKNGELGILSASIARNNSNIATATVDRGIWQTTTQLHGNTRGRSGITKHMGARRDTIMSFYKVSR